MDLIREKAAGLGKEVQVRQGLVQGAFEVLMSADRDRHDGMVSEAAQELAPHVEVLVLAQASMARLVPRLQTETGLPILTSPRLGIEHTRRVLEQPG